MIDRSIFALPGIKGALAFLVAVAALRALAVVGQAWALATALVNLWYGGAVLDQAGWLALFLVCFVGRQALVTVQESYLERYADARADELRQDLLRTVFTEGGSVVQAHGTGTVATMVLEGVDQVETYIRLILPKTVGVVVVPFVLLVFIFPLDWVSGVIALVAFPFIILYMVILGHTAQDEAAKQHATFQVMSNHFIDSLRGIDTLKLFGRGKAHGASIYEVSERFREATMKTLRVATLSSTVLDLFSTFSLAAVAIMLGFRLVDGTLVLFPALLVLILVPEYFKPVRDFASDYHASLDGKNASSPSSSSSGSATRTRPRAPRARTRRFPPGTPMRASKCATWDSRIPMPRCCATCRSRCRASGRWASWARAGRARARS
ncbi:ABC transporter transmembrane domain-containing protein [Eggerthella sinensis]|uniref:ABC transporter transmembrane domain-containing protein n=1 Tax=Eggerthella sinensis TaxID=242230 RepID=UPI0022E05E3E|nr:ABC transporter transmembrane domain-containing protein [Eggerthella sinensis]